MRKITLTILSVLVMGVLASGSPAADDAKVDELKNIIEEQRKEIRTLKARVNLLTRKVDRLKADEGSEKNDNEAKDENEASSDPPQLVKINSSLGQWNGYHYLNYQWRERKGWPVVQGMEKGVYKLVGNKRARRSRIMHKAELKGDFGVTALVLARKNARLEIVHDDEERPYKRGFQVDFPEGQPARVQLRRRGDELSATVNGEKVIVADKHYGGDAKATMHVAFTVDKKNTLLIKSMQVYAPKD